MNAARGADRRRRVTRVTVTMAVLAAALLVAGGTAVQTRVEASAADAAPSGGTLRVAMVEDDPAPWWGFDPVAAFTTSEVEVLSCCLQRTLMSYPALPGYQGLQPQPDLADGPPTVSADGLTWTFHIRSDVHYAPPLEHVEVTSEDFARALQRAGRADNPPFLLFGLIAGFDEFQSGDADTISGLLTPNPSTLQVKLVHPESDLGQILALPWSAPIPPGLDSQFLSLTQAALPPGATADGGYGIFQSATGPYMFEGADQTDYGSTSAPSPPLGYDEPRVSPDNKHLLGGSFTLVRNPSWQQDSDPIRPALPDRIVITLVPQDEAYAGLLSDQFDTVIGASPTPPQLKTLTVRGPRDRVTRMSALATQLVTLNLSIPPFNDPVMRRAFAAALNAEAVRRDLNIQYRTNTFGPAPTHLIPDPFIDDLLSHWAGTGSVSRERRGSATPAVPCHLRDCPAVTFGGGTNDLQEGPATREVARALRAIGLRPRFVPVSKSTHIYDLTKAGNHNRIYRRTWCRDPRNGFAACLTGWQSILPNAGSMIDGVFAAGIFGDSATGMGMSPRELGDVGSAPVPSIDQQKATCLATLGVQTAPCWAALDQWLTHRLVAAVPVAALQEWRAVGNRVVQSSVDQANLEVALNKVKLSDSSG